LKRRFLEQPVLIQPISLPLRLETDASKKACGTVLSQKGPMTSGTRSHTCRNPSLKQNATTTFTTGAPRHYPCLGEWRHYLEGAPHAIEILSDHKNLEFFWEPGSCSRRQARWALYLTRFHFTLTHVTGKSMTTADALSRRPDHEDGSTDNDDITLLPTSLFARSMDTYELGDDSLRDSLHHHQASDPACHAIRDALTASPARRDLQPIGRFNKTFFYILADHMFLVKLISTGKSPEFSMIRHRGPSGCLKTLELVQRAYWWPGMHRTIFDFVDGCTTCQQTKNLPNCPGTPACPIPPELNAPPFSCVSLDFITELPPSLGFDAIAVFIDHDVTKAAVIAPCHTTITATQQHNSIAIMSGSASASHANSSPIEVLNSLPPSLLSCAVSSPSIRPQHCLSPTDGWTNRTPEPRT